VKQTNEIDLEKIETLDDAFVVISALLGELARERAEKQELNERVAKLEE